jgi:pseudouridine 5'-phosphatase
MPQQTPLIRAVALDMDGLTLNTEDLYGEVGHRMMARRGKAFRDSVRQRMTGRPAPAAYAVLIEAESLQESWEELHAESTSILSELLPTRVQPMPGVIDLLDELDRCSIPRCIATSSPLHFAEKALRFAGLIDRIDFIVTSEHVAHGKPAPDIYQLAAKKFGCSPSEVLVLEDSPIGATAGVAAGCFVVTVPSPHVDHQAFQGVQFPVPQIDDPKVLKLIRESVARDD